MTIDIDARQAQHLERAAAKPTRHPPLKSRPDGPTGHKHSHRIESNTEARQVLEGTAGIDPRNHGSTWNRQTVDTVTAVIFAVSASLWESWID